MFKSARAGACTKTINTNNVAWLYLFPNQARNVEVPDLTVDTLISSHHLGQSTITKVAGMLLSATTWGHI
jgi:hypothetical protein